MGRPAAVPRGAASERRILLVLQGLFDLSVFIAISWAVSEDRHRRPWPMVISGLLLQCALALLLIRLLASHVVFQWFGNAVATSDPR